MPLSYGLMVVSINVGVINAPLFQFKLVDGASLCYKIVYQALTLNFKQDSVLKLVKRKNE